MLLKEKEHMLKEKEKEITHMEMKLRSKEKFLSEKLKQIEYEETKFVKEKSDFELKRMDIEKSAKQTPITPYTPAPSINTSFYPNLSNLEEKSVSNINSTTARQDLSTINSSRLNNTAAASEEMNQKYNRMKENYDELEKQFSKESQTYQKQIKYDIVLFMFFLISY